MTVSTGRAVVYDLAVVVVLLLFANAAHDAGAQGIGRYVALGTCFVAGLAAGWGAARAWRTPSRVWPTGVIVWVVTVVVGVVLRGLLVPDAGFALPFVAITAAFLGVTLIGWRALASVPPRRPAP